MARLSTKFIAPLFAAVLLGGVVAPAHATPVSGCADDGTGTGNQVCDLWEFDAMGSPVESTSASSIYQPGDWLYGYSFILEGPTWDGTINSVSDIIVIDRGTVWLYSDGDPQFGQIYNDALTGLFNGLPVEQAVGDGSLPAIDLGLGVVIGLALEDVNGLAMLAPVSFLSGSGDTFIIHSDGDVIVPGQVPEPTTVSLVALGGLALVLRRRFKRTV